MDTIIILPTDAFVTSAFAELLADVTNLLESAQAQKPRDTDEIKFWRSQLNALNKAEAYWTQGTRPTMATQSYFIASASRPGALVHRLTKQGGVLICSCEAGQKGTLCWHHMLVNVIERAAELESLNEKRETMKDEESGSDPSSFIAHPSSFEHPIPHHAEAAAWLAGQQQLQTRLDATAAYLEALRSAQGRRTIDGRRRTEDEPRRLGYRLATARKKSAYFTSAFYLAA